MIKGKLVNKDQSFSVEVTMPESANQLLKNSNDGGPFDIEVFANQCMAVNPPQVAIRTPYDFLSIEGARYKINSIKGINQGTFLVVSAGTILIVSVQAEAKVSRLAS